MPLVRDAIQQLGAAGSEIVTIFDFQDAFHTLRIALLSQKYLGITPYYGSPTYIYQRLEMGLSISPSLFMHFITQVLDQIEYQKHFIAIMDDVLIHSKRKDHMKHIVALLEATIMNGLKISPKKCQL